MQEERYCKVKTQGRSVKFGCRKKDSTESYNSRWIGTICLSQKKELYRKLQLKVGRYNLLVAKKMYRKLQLKVGRYNLPVSPRLPPPVLPLQMELPGTQAGISKIFRYWQTKVESETNWRDLRIWHLICYGVSSHGSSYCLADWMRSCTGGKCADCRQATPAALSSLCTTIFH